MPASTNVKLSLAQIRLILIQKSFIEKILPYFTTTSSWPYSTRNIRGKSGHGWWADLEVGGSESNSNVVTLFASILSEVAIQSTPVSPPPMMRTFFPLASMWGRL